MANIIRGTNVAIHYKVANDIDLSQMTNCELYMQVYSGKTLVSTSVKDVDDLEIDIPNKTISYMLTQQETLAFEVGQEVAFTLIALIEEVRRQSITRRVGILDTPKNEVMR